MKCGETVSDSVTYRGGGHFRQCGKLAKFVVTSNTTGSKMLRCGIHARKYNEPWRDCVVQTVGKKRTVNEIAYVPRHLIWHAGWLKYECGEARCAGRGIQEARIDSVSEGEIRVVCRFCGGYAMVGIDSDPYFLEQYGPDIRQKLIELRDNINNWLDGGLGFETNPAGGKS